MSSFPKVVCLLSSVALLLVAGFANAESSRDVGQFVIHYNALPTEMLDADVARAYSIQRSKFRGMLNIAVLKKSAGGPGKPVSAMVSAHATNLSGQITELKMREIREQDAIYYIGEFRVADEETLNFTVKVSPEQSSPPHTITFRKQFFVN
jgi:hypothetical protein